MGICFEHSWVSRWRAALPVFDDAHRTRVAELEGVLRGRGVALAGAAFHGSGIDAAVKSAEDASRVL
jgi:oxygen-dependent protoporphyrinogen oxidase